MFSIKYLVNYVTSLLAEEYAQYTLENMEYITLIG
jgi:hypothetical protein